VTLDLAVAGIVVLLAVLGAVSGALRQLLRLGAAVVAYLVARLLGPPVAAGLIQSLPAPAARATAGLVLFFAAFVVAMLAGNLLLHSRKDGPRPGPADRALGALLGAAKASLVLWVVLSALAIVDRPVGPSWFRLDPSHSDFAALARRHNVLERWEGSTGSALRGLLRVAKDPERAARLLADADGRKLLEDPRVQMLVEEARGGKDPVSLSGSPAALRLLSDPAFLERLDRAQRRLDLVERGR
jgi:membrane protein required for colicin V production